MRDLKEEFRAMADEGTATGAVTVLSRAQQQSATIEDYAPVPRPRQRRHAALIAIAVAVAIAVGGFVLARDDNTQKTPKVHVATPDTAGTATPPTTVPPSPKVPDANALGITQQSLEDDVARVVTLYAGATAEAPGGRPILAAEAIHCDYQRAIPALTQPTLTFASDRSLDQPLSEDDLVAACRTHGQLVRLEDGTLIDPVKTQLGDAPYVLCIAPLRGPIYDLSAAPSAIVPKPVVVFGALSCTQAGYSPLTPDLLADVNTRRKVEIRLRAVPGADCPSYDETASWIRAVSQRAGTPLAVSQVAMSSAMHPSNCWFHLYVDWDNGTVEVN